MIRLPSLLRRPALRRPCFGAPVRHLSKIVVASPFAEWLMLPMAREARSLTHLAIAIVILTLVRRMLIARQSVRLVYATDSSKQSV